MGLTIREKPSFIKRFIDSARKTTFDIKKDAREWILELILLLLVVMNLWVGLKIVLTMYIVFYFIDRWGIKQYINSLNQPVVSAVDKETLKKIDKIKKEKDTSPEIQTYGA